MNWSLIYKGEAWQFGGEVSLWGEWNKYMETCMFISCFHVYIKYCCIVLPLFLFRAHNGKKTINSAEEKHL